MLIVGTLETTLHTASLKNCTRIGFPFFFLSLSLSPTCGNLDISLCRFVHLSFFFFFNTTGVELVRLLFVAPIIPNPDADNDHTVADCSSGRSGNRASIASMRLFSWVIKGQS